MAVYFFASRSYLCYVWGNARLLLSQGICISIYKQKKGFCQNKIKILGTSINFIFWLCGLPSVGFHTTIFFKKKKQTQKPAVKFFLLVRYLFIYCCFWAGGCHSYFFSPPPPQSPSHVLWKQASFFLFPLCWYSRHLFLATGFVGLWSLAVNLGFLPIVPVLGLVALAH